MEREEKQCFLEALEQSLPAESQGSSYNMTQEKRQLSPTEVEVRSTEVLRLQNPENILTKSQKKNLQRSNQMTQPDLNKETGAWNGGVKCLHQETNPSFVLRIPLHRRESDADAVKSQV